MTRRLTTFLIAILSLGTLWKLYDKLIDGFYLYRTYPPSELSFSEEFSFTQSFEDVQSRLNQPFYYLASGSQSFVFLSADRTLVLKLFKHYRWKPPFYLSWWGHHQANPKQKEGLIATYQSCLFCMQELKKETGLLYLQLTPQSSPLATIVIHNRLGVKYELPLHSTSFMIQSYAEPVGDTLLKLKTLGQDDIAKERLSALFHHLVQRRQQGFTDKDPNFLNNFGFIGQRVISIDVGGLIKDPKKDLHYFCTQELKKVSRTLLPWLHHHYPQLLTEAIELIETTKCCTPSDPK